MDWTMQSKQWPCEFLGSYDFYVLSVLIMCAVVGVYMMRKKGRSPPGPLGLPIIGHLHLLAKHPHRALYHLSKVHGPLMWLRFGSVPVIVASTPDAARLILKTHDQIFAGRPRPTAAICTSYNCTDITFSAPNSYWRLMRQICVSDLVSSKRVEAFRPLREAEVCRLVGSIMREIMQANAMYADMVVPVMVSIRAKLLQASNNMISRMVLGKTLPEIMASSVHADDPSLNIVDLLDEMIHCLGIFNMGDFIPYVEWMDLQGVRRRSRAVASKLDIILQEILNSRRCQRQQSDNTPLQCGVLLDVLLRLAIPNTHISDDNIKSIILDMFIGGTDTSAYTLEWALAELLFNPSKMKSVQEEIDKVVGKERLVNESDIMHLPYLRAVVNETMRLHPLLPFLIPHAVTQKCKLLGFDVPMNAQVFVNVWAIGQDKDTWENPQEFKPERFLTSDVSVAGGVGGKHFELLPFGSGRRGCPGWMLGMINVQIQLASLLQGFHWSSLPNHNIEEKYGIMTVKAEPLVALVAPKLPPHLYIVP